MEICLTIINGKFLHTLFEWEIIPCEDGISNYISIVTLFNQKPHKINLSILYNLKIFSFLQKLTRNFHIAIDILFFSLIFTKKLIK